MSLSRKIFSHWKNFYSRLKPILGVKIHFQSTITVLASIVTILVNFEAILIYSKAYCKKITLKLTCRVDIYKNPLQYCFKTYKYCDNNCKYCTCRWTHFLSIGSILVSIKAILKRLSVRINFTSQFQSTGWPKSNLCFNGHGPILINLTFLKSLPKIIWNM